LEISKLRFCAEIPGIPTPPEREAQVTFGLADFGGPRLLNVAYTLQMASKVM